MPQDTAMTLRLNRETTTKLRDSARANHRSLASEIRFALDRYLADTALVSKPAAPAATDFDLPEFDE
jgi:hypothetical protein